MHATHRLPRSHETTALPLLHLIKIKDQISERKNSILGISDGILPYGNGSVNLLFTCKINTLLTPLE